ncbi:MAG: alpha/beta hydrolase [Cyclobacteriaceae bacterium]|jgi:3-oxoadipate enol-lactonase|nr:alpha/beta hydrolase [Cyclobacteriaceae bacterium]
MPKIKINGADLYYEIHGHGPETMLFSHGLLFSCKIFKAQVDFFKARYKCVIYDHRGQGQSEVTEQGYDIESIYQDAVELIRELSLGPCHMVGLSMGGFIAMRIAARNPELLKSLILIETSAEVEPNKIKYNLLMTVTKILGISAVINKVMPILFAPTFLNDPDRKDLVHEWKHELLSNKKTITNAVKGVIDRQSVLNELDNIHSPALIIVGDEDIATPAEKAKNIKLKIETPV